MRSEFADGIARATTLIQERTYPLIHEDHRGMPELVASCVFVQIGAAVFLVTAAHAIRSYPKGLLTRGRTHLFALDGRATISKARGPDHFDIAAIRLSADFVRDQTLSVIPA